MRMSTRMDLGSKVEKAWVFGVFYGNVSKTYRDVYDQLLVNWLVVSCMSEEQS